MYTHEFHSRKTMSRTIHNGDVGSHVYGISINMDDCVVSIPLQVGGRRVLCPAGEGDGCAVSGAIAQ